MNTKVNDYLERPQKWFSEMSRLREILLEYSLEEDLKWGKPCYAYHKSNVAIIQGFKE